MFFATQLTPTGGGRLSGNPIECGLGTAWVNGNQCFRLRANRVFAARDLAERYDRDQAVIVKLWGISALLTLVTNTYSDLNYAEICLRDVSASRRR